MKKLVRFIRDTFRETHIEAMAKEITFDCTVMATSDFGVIRCRTDRTLIDFLRANSV